MLKHFHAICSFIALSLCLWACTPHQSASSSTVDASQYDSFWIWGNISSAPYLSQAKEIYILQGEVRLNKGAQQPVLIPQGVAVLKVPHQKVWLVYRNHLLNWRPEEVQLIAQRIQQWEQAGNQVQGIQIDFDSPTKDIHSYALFLEKLRAALPKKYRLSITGLLDWGNIQDQQALHLLRENIDELVVQSYQGSTTIPNYQSYLNKVSKLQLPYKIGIVQHGEWNPELNFAADPNFKGYVVFLLRSAP